MDRRGSFALMVTALAVMAAPARAGEGTLELVGHEPLGARGMNSALAVHGSYAYVGSRSDGPAPKGGIAVVDLADPASPRVVHTISSADPGLSSRELRVWDDLLIVLHFACEGPQSCLDYGAPPDIRFYDIRGEAAAAPRLLHTYTPSRVPHEFFLWQDPERPGRALLYLSTLTATGGDDLLVTDVSRAREGVVAEVASWAANIPAGDGREVDLHSLSLSHDGRTAYLAHLAAGFLVLDTSEVAEARARPVMRLITPVDRRAEWGAPGAHSAIPLPGRPWALTTDEVYGSTLGVAPALGVSVAVGCPWGWTRLIDLRDPASPVVRGEYRLKPYNEQARCSPERRLESEQATFSSHNPTATRDLAFISWHSGGLQAIDVSDPARPAQLAQFLPENLPAVITEDPTFSTGSDKAVMWSYPILRDGLVYVADIRNGLFILRYDGPHEAQLGCFTEGNSNLGRPCPVFLPGGATPVRRGRALVRVACTGRESCAGRLRVRARGRSAGTARFQVPAGAERAVPVRLQAFARKARSASARAYVGGEQATAQLVLGGVRAARWSPPRASRRLERQMPPAREALLAGGLVCLTG